MPPEEELLHADLLSQKHGLFVLNKAGKDEANQIVRKLHFLD